MPGPVKINRVSAVRRFRSSRSGKKLNKEMLERLARLNLELWSPDRIRSSIGVDDGDLAALSGLADRMDGWRDYVISPEAVAGDYGRLAALGLIRFRWPTRKIHITDAGRFLLSLTAVAPDNQTRSLTLDDEDR